MAFFAAQSEGATKIDYFSSKYWRSRDMWRAAGDALRNLAGIFS